MVRQSNTVCRNVRRKPAHSVEHKGFRIFGWSLPAPCKLPQREKTRQKAKTTPVSREERGWRSSSKSMLHLQMSNVCQILFRPTALLFIPHTTLLTAPSVPSQEDIRVLNKAAPAYLHIRKPEVPSGPLGWRITWLFERTGSSGCCTLIQAGLSWHWLSWGVSSEEALPKILLRASAYSASLWARDFICWAGRDEAAGFPVLPLFVGRFKIRIWGGGAAGRESSWTTTAVRIGELADFKLDFFASWFIFSFASSLLSISPLSAASSQLSATSSSSMFKRDCWVAGWLSSLHRLNVPHSGHETTASAQVQTTGSSATGSLFMIR